MSKLDNILKDFAYRVVGGALIYNSPECMPAVVDGKALDQFVDMTKVDIVDLLRDIINYEIADRTQKQTQKAHAGISQDNNSVQKGLEHTTDKE